MRTLRKNLDIILIIVVVAFAVTIYYGYGSYRRAGRPGQAIAATVNNTAISFYALDQAFRNFLSQYDSKTLSSWDEETFALIRRLVLENLINSELLYQEAQARGIRVPARDVETEIEKIRAQFPSESEFRRYLEYQGLTLPALRESVRRELMIRKLTESLVADLPIPDEEVAKYYETHQDLFTTPAQYRLLRMTFLSKEDAEKALRRLYLGEDFASVAREVSLDEAAQKGGDIGWVPETSLPQEACEVLEKIKDDPRNVTPPIQVGSTYVVYRVLEWKPKVTKPFEEVKETIRQSLLAEQKRVRTDHLLAELRKKSTITIAESLQLPTPTPSGTSSEGEAK
ncbi:MAG: SurA N-terminal domain-containing protein [Candidatus Caldatribacterium sp.]|nr:SurA N-terminal domain-containing protein [Candidatus Caldatribacterium sp.]